MKATKRFYSLASFFLVLVFSQFLTSCKQSSSPSDVQPGSVTGVASLWNSAGPLPSSAGVTVALDNSNYSTQTDSIGRWEIYNVAPGNYNITVSKPGFGLCRAYGVSIAGPGMSNVDPSMTFGVASSDAVTLSNVAITMNSEGATMLSGEFSGGSSNASADGDVASIFFLDLNPNVQPGDAHTLWQNGSSSNQFALSLESIHSAGISSGTTVYVSASQVNFTSVWHPGGGISSGTYNDPVDNSMHFISPGPRSNVVAVVIP